METKEIAASRDFLGEFVRRLLPESPVRVTFVVFAKPSLDDLLLAVWQRIKKLCAYLTTLQEIES